MVSLTHTHPLHGLMYLWVDLFPDVNEIFFTFMHIHIDIGKVITVNKNDIATKIHPQTPRPALGLSVKIKKHTVLITVLSMSPHLHPHHSLNVSCLHGLSHRIHIKTLKRKCCSPWSLLCDKAINDPYPATKKVEFSAKSLQYSALSIDTVSVQNILKTQE